jgi:hypothetical protein
LAKTAFHSSKSQKFGSQYEGHFVATPRPVTSATKGILFWSFTGLLKAKPLDA